MKELNELNFPDDVRYAESHEWARSGGDGVKVGISDYAQDQLGDIVFVELPDVGESFEKGAEFGTVESVKAVSELYMPVSGEIVAINEALDEEPELVNSAPFGDGWMLRIRLADPSEAENLLDAAGYRALVE